MTPELAEDGSVALRDTSGVVVAQIAAGYALDSNVDPHSGEAAMSPPLSYQLVTVDGGPALRVGLDAAWLAAPERVFPVRVDPTLTTTQVTGDVYV